MNGVGGPIHGSEFAQQIPGEGSARAADAELKMCECRSVRSKVSYDDRSIRRTRSFMTISSMTGFARASGAHDAWTWVWEVRSVNGRSLEMRFRLPPGHDGLEPGLRKAVSGVFTRGSINALLSPSRCASSDRARRR